MKKKLKLTRQTIAHLTHADLRAAAGAGNTGLCGGSDACGTQLGCDTQAINGCLTGVKTVC